MQLFHFNPHQKKDFNVSYIYLVIPYFWIYVSLALPVVFTEGGTCISRKRKRVIQSTSSYRETTPRRDSSTPNAAFLRSGKGTSCLRTVEALISNYPGNSKKWSQLELVAYENGFL